MPNPVFRPAAISVLALLSASCASGSIAGPVQDLDYTAVARACAPNDGPAVSIYFAPAPVRSLEPSTPYVRVDVWRPVEDLTGQSWVVGGAEAEGSAVYHSSAGHEVVTSGRVTVDGVAADSALTGLVDLRFSDSGHLATEFHAAWISHEIACG